MIDGTGTWQRVSNDPSLNAEWHEILPGLWQGGSGQSPDDRFDIVYTFGHASINEPVLDGVPEITRQLLDTERSDVTHPWDEIRQFAIDVAEQVEFGQQVLVRCNAGWNRSGVVVARAMLEMGFDLEESIDLIRETRSPHALSNRRFVSWLRQEAKALESQRIAA